MQPSGSDYAPLRFIAVAILALTASACGDRAEPGATSAEVERPSLQNKADSVAMVLYDSLGGPAAWASVPLLRFNFGGERDGQPEVWRRHLWNRETGEYRMEWDEGEDSSFVSLFNVETKDGQVFLNGAPVDTAQKADLLENAYRGFINDTYWLLAPIKAFDPGVTRTYVADSSNGEHDVIQLAFEGVGLTPGDRYWFYVNKDTGRMDKWAMMLQSMDSTAAPRVNLWEGYERDEVPGGTVQVATRKPNPAGGTTILTNAVEMPTNVPAEMWTDPQPRLGQ